MFLIVDSIGERVVNAHMLSCIEVEEEEVVGYAGCGFTLGRYKDRPRAKAVLKELVGLMSAHDRYMYHMPDK